jgi:hypothetical protein
MARCLTTVMIVAVTLACRREVADMAHPEPPAAIPEMTSEAEGAFHDLVFAATHHSKWEVTAEATHRGEPMKFVAELSPTWKAGAIAGNPSFSGVVTIRSAGPASDALVKSMDLLYGSQVRPAGMIAAVRFAAITLGGDPSHVETERVDMKLFFESEDEERYAELYLNFDVPKHKVELREKDEGYRGPVIRALAEGEEARSRRTKG